MSTLRIAMKMSVGTNELRNIFWVAGAYAIIDNAQDIVDYIAGAWTTGSTGNHLTDRLSSGFSLYGADVKDVADVENPTIPYAITGGSIAGAASGDLLPLQTCLLITFKALTARPNQSRKYLGGFCEPSHDGAGWTTDVKTIVANWADYLLAMPTGLDTGAALVVSRLNAGVLVGSNLLDHYTITSYARTQRRRTPGRGI